MESTTAASVLGSVTLVTGPEEFLSERTVGSVVGAVRSGDSDADVTEVSGADLTPGGLAELTSPSLFATARAVVVRRLTELPDDAADGLLTYAANPAPDVALVLVHEGGQRHKALLDRLRATSAVREVRSEPPKAWELPRFVTAEVRSGGARIEEEAAAFLVDAVGTDLRALASAAGQLAADFPGQTIEVDLVRRYFDGRAEVKSFAVADAAIGGQLSTALEQLRWALGNGVAPVLLTGAFATGLRSLGRFLSAARGSREADLARLAGVPSWKLKTLRTQSRGWTPDGLSAAIEAVARADAEVKGASVDADYALERMVITVARVRSAH